MSPKTKIISAILLVLAAYFASIAWGVHQITSSEVFPLSKKALANYLVAQKSMDAVEPYHLRWWWSWNFKSTPKEGFAEFPLCTPAKNCYLIKAKTVDNGVWRVIEIQPQQ